MEAVVKLSGWYAPAWIAERGLIMGYGYTGVYNLITKKDPTSGIRVKRVDADRLEAYEVSKGSRICRYKVKGEDLIKYLKRANLPLPKIIN
jgi:hypothetical protein